MKKLLLLAMVLAVLAGLSSICHAQSAKEAVRALQKLQARVEVGISYRDYAPALGDAKFEVSLFLRSIEAKENKKLADKVEQVINDHEIALDIWGLYFAELQQGFTRQGIIPTKDIQNLTTVFSEVTDVIRNSPVGDKRFISLSEVLGMIWKSAGNEMEEAMKLLSQ